jgi:hypothetical protein
MKTCTAPAWKGGQPDVDVASWPFSTVLADHRIGRYRGVIADMVGRAKNDVNDPKWHFGTRNLL